MLRLFEYNGLDKKQLQELRALVKICTKADGYQPKIFWEAVAMKRTHPGDYCVYQGNSLVAYLSTFNFEEDSMEVSCLIHPDFRHQGLFLDMFNYARNKFLNHQPESYLFSCHESATKMEQLYKSLGARLSHKEFTLHRNKNTIEEFSPMEDFELRVPSLRDALVMAKIEKECFDSSEDLMFSRFKQIIPLAHRRHWLAYYKGACMGKMHARLEENGVFLHNIAILPSYQGKGFGNQLLKHAINALLSEGHSQFHLMVDGMNERALTLYLNCGFEVKSVFNFWQVEKPEEASHKVELLEEDLVH